MSTRDKWVRRFAVNETAKHKNGFTIYKITSILFPLESPEAVTVVSVWKRYSDIQQLHRSIGLLHAGLHLRGKFPALPKNSFFKRFQPEVIEERAKAIKSLLEFVAEHRLLFTSTDFVNFLQTGYPEPNPQVGVINAIRSSLHLPIEETPPLEYQTSDDEAKSPSHSARNTQHLADGSTNKTNTHELDVSQIPIYEAADVEIRESPKNPSTADSFESIPSIESIGSDFYDELSKMTVEKTKPSVKTKTVLPDLINFDAPSTSKLTRFEDYHTMKRRVDSETVSVTSTSVNDDASVSTRAKEMDDNYAFENTSLYEVVSGVARTKEKDKTSVSDVRSASSLSNVQYSMETDGASRGVSRSTSLSNVSCAKETEESYVFEAGYLLTMGARCEDRGQYRQAFHCYRAGIEKMLIGVRSDCDTQRRAIIKEKISKYLSYAETIYTNHLSDLEDNMLSECEVLECEARSLRNNDGGVLDGAPPLRMLRRPYDELGEYRVLAAIASSVMLVHHRTEHACYAMKVIQKIPHNLTEFDEYFLRRTNETRQPILPTLVPYVVPLHAYIETNSLMFLILSYAPGERLLDYIRNYTRSAPNTPVREVNLENVFAEPSKQKRIDVENDNVDQVDCIANVEPGIDNIREVEDVNENLEVKTDSLDNIGLTVNELVINSQKLLRNVDKVLTEVPKIKDVEIEDVKMEVTEDRKKRIANKDVAQRKTAESVRVNRVLPQGAACGWAAQLLCAIHGLHNCGVVCRDLNPRNILLGDKGQIIVTYFVSYQGLDMALAKTKMRRGEVNMYIAPELYRETIIDVERDESLDKVCDFWSYGAILYELLCGVPLSHYHRSMFTDHTILHLPDGLPLEVQSLLTQLLTYEPSQRLGGGKEGVEEIKQHPYFRNVDWPQVYSAWTMPR